MSQVGLIVGETISQVTMHHGPLPQASDLAAYNAVDPSFAERIVRMAEREQERRHTLPDEFLDREYKLKSRGQHYALLLAMLILMFAAYLAYLGNSEMAGKVAIGTLIGIVGIFVSGRAIDAFAGERDRPDADEGAAE